MIGKFDEAHELDRFRTYQLQHLEKESHPIWDKFRQAVLEYWIDKYPGTRPPMWWDFDAPRQPLGRFPGHYYDGKLMEPRKRIGGIGKTPWDSGVAYVPSFRCGVPAYWETFDDDDPPVFESEASYLKRYRLLTAFEKRTLKPSDYKPHSI